MTDKALYMRKFFLQSSHRTRAKCALQAYHFNHYCTASAVILGRQALAYHKPLQRLLDLMNMQSLD